MDWKQVERWLERPFTAAPRRYGSTEVIERRKPFRLAAAMEVALSEEELEEWGDLEAWPGSLSELLPEHGIEERARSNLCCGMRALRHSARVTPAWLINTPVVDPHAPRLGLHDLL